MSPRPQIRFFAPHPENKKTRLNLVEYVGLIVIDPPIGLKLPPPPSVTTINDVELSSLLSDDFLAANAIDTNSNTALVGRVLNDRLTHSLAATILPDRLFLGIPEDFSSVGLQATRAPRHTRLHGIPTGVKIPYSPLKSLKRPRWALSVERLGTTDIELSCGSALVKPPEGAVANNRKLNSSTSMCHTDVPDATQIVQKSCIDDNLGLLDHIQALVTNTEVYLPHVPLLEDKRSVQRTIYEGICNPSLVSAVVQCANEAVQTGASWAAVLAKPPRSHAVWKGDLARTGEPGFTLDAAEIFVVLNDAIVVAQMRAPCDAV